MRKLPFMAALFYIPLRQVDVQAVMKDLTVRYSKPAEDAALDAEYDEQDSNSTSDIIEEIKCFDLSKPGFIGVPRAWGLKKFGHLPFADITVKQKRRPSLFPRKIRPRDDKQAEFMRLLSGIVNEASPVDAVANAKTGTGKTVTALWLEENAIQCNLLVTVPTVYLLNQWRARIRDMMGSAWAEENVGHLQQDTMDLRLITLGVAASLARRDYPVWVKRHFTAIIMDEFHRIPTPTIGSSLAKYPASIRIALTATNRNDAFRRVGEFHMGKPRVVSRQEVMKPQVFIHSFEYTLNERIEVFNERHMLSMLSRNRQRNHKLATLIYDGWERGRIIVGLSDRTDQLVHLYQMLQAELPENTVGIIAGKYKWDGVDYKPKQAEKDWIAENCQIILATYGIFDTGADIDRLDMGVELTPRINLKQAIGRVLRIRPGKPTPEWHSINDRIIVRSQTGADLFADPNASQIYQPLITDAEARLSSYRFQQGTVHYVS